MVTSRCVAVWTERSAVFHPMPVPPTIRLATRDEARAIAALSRTEIEQGLPWRWTPPRVQRAVDDARTNVCVAVQQASMLGFGIMVYADDTAHLSLLAVSPEARRQGVGTALLQWLEQVALVAGIVRVQLEARHDNDSALAFYRRHAYAQTGTVPGMYLGVADGVRLEKLLVPHAADVQRP
jgi:[ribosomal protein S18]-alanine N-acetyltransferase